MNSRGPTIGLLVGNVALVCAIVWVRTRPSPEEFATPNSITTGPQPPPAIERVELPASGASATKALAVQFTWRAVADRDLKRYIAKLRQVQCPEETIQDIILAEVDRLYQAKEAALGFRGEFIKVWEQSEPSREKDFEKAARFRQLRVEKRNLIYELLGIDVPGDIPSLVGSNFNTAWEEALALLPLEKRGPVRAAQDRFWERTETLRKRLDNLLLPEDAEEYRRLRAERVAELQKILTPLEFEEVEIRTSTTSKNLKTELNAFLPSEQEFRELFRIKRDLHEATYVPGQVVGDEERQRAQERTAASLKAEEQIKATLGEGRYAEYQRAQDSDFQQISRVATDAGLPRDKAIAVYDLQKQTQQAMQQRLLDPNLPPAQRNALQNQIMTESIERTRQLLGDTAFQQLQQRMPGQYQLPASRTRSRALNTLREVNQPVQVFPAPTP